MATESHSHPQPMLVLPGLASPSRCTELIYLYIYIERERGRGSERERERETTGMNIYTQMSQMYLHTYRITCLHVYVCIHVLMCIYLCIYLCIYTHTYTHVSSASMDLKCHLLTSFRTDFDKSSSCSSKSDVSSVARRC